jgi:chaperonin GroEL (HSP60 family)
MRRRVYAGTEKTIMATIVLRSTTSNHLDDLERAIDDGVNVVKSILKDPRLGIGIGAGETCGDLWQWFEGAQSACQEYGQALEVVPRTLGGREGTKC